MTLLLAVLAQGLHAALVLAAAPLLAGVLGWIEARLQGRAGPSLLAPWHRLVRLIRKQPIRPETATRLSGAVPVVVFAAIAAAAALVPSFTLGMALAPLADLLAIAGLLALARLALALAGFDQADAVGGLGAGRAMAVAGLAEPALLLVILGFALLAGGTTLVTVVAGQSDNAGAPAAWGLGLAALGLVALAETGTLPAGDAPGAAFALGCEAATLAFSGRDLALLDAAFLLQRVLWLNLIAVLFVPFGLAPETIAVEVMPLAWLLGLACWVVKLLGLGVGLKLAEALLGGGGTDRAPRLLGVAVLLGALAVAMLLGGMGAT